MRLDKFLCDNGFGTRTEVKQLIKRNSVIVNDNVIKDSAFKINKEDKILVEGRDIIYKEYHYYMLNKPAGVVTAREDAFCKTVMDILDISVRDLSPVGRLDKDTEGLLLITNNGTLNHNMLSPKKHVDKTYWVKLESDISNVNIQKLIEGVDIGDDKLTLPSKVKKISNDIIELTIHEGRFHQVKRMMEAVDNKVVFLKRLSFGPLVLPMDLSIGSYRELTSDEILLLSEYM